MINEEQFKALVAKNLTNYRKINNLTQLDLAEKLSYSDKATLLLQCYATNYRLI